jgi:PAS domain S-box-containing protein
MGPEGTTRADENGATPDDRGVDGRSERMRYQEVFEFVPDAQFVTDNTGVILEANQAAAVLLGCAKEFLIDKPLALFSIEGDRQRFDASLERLSRGIAADAFESRLKRRDGDIRHIYLTARVSDWDGQWPGQRRLFWIARDLTEQRRAEADRAELQRRLSTAEEEERRSFSRELHDQVGQTLTALMLQIQAVRAAGALPEPVAAKLNGVQHLAEELGRQLHNIAVQLRPTVLDDLGLEPALRQLVAGWQASTGIAADFQSAGLGTGRFSSGVETTLYRVVQEALTNVARHAAALRVGVVVSRREGHAVAIVEDNGRGFDPDAASRAGSGKLGLLGMRERVAIAGGTLEIESHPGKGTTVYARIPLSDARGSDDA